MMLGYVSVLLMGVLTMSSGQILPAVAPNSNPCVDTAPDCAAICDEQPGNVADACSPQTPIGNYLR